MKTIIAGSRSIINIDHLFTAMKLCPFIPSSIISGGARGVDTVAIYYAGFMQLPYPDIYYASWGKGANFNPNAGHERNALMASKGDALVAVWDGKSGGTKNMIDTAKEKGLEVYVHNVAEWKEKRSLVLDELAAESQRLGLYD